MKVITAFGILLICTFSLFAQQVEVPESLSLFRQSKNVEWGVSLGPELKFSSLNGDFVSALGSRLDVSIQNCFTVGIAGYLMSGNSEFVRRMSSGDDSTFIASYNSFGIHLKYIFFKNSPVHISIPVFFHGGVVKVQKEVGVYVDPFYGTTSDYEVYEGNSFVAIEPGIYLELDLTETFHMFAGLTYKYVIESGVESFSEEEIQAMAFVMGLKFGKQ